MPEEVTRLRIFVASPGDVLDEREHLRLVVDELNRTLADRLGLTLDLLDWRTHVAPGMGRPQQVIFDQLALEKWDNFVGILWARFGTPPGTTHSERGEPFLSGTEEEFTLAYQAWKETGRPQILFYRCLRSIPAISDPDQLKLVQEFFAEFEAAGAHPGLYQTYKTNEDFAWRLRNDLEQVLYEVSEEKLAEVPDKEQEAANLQAQELRAAILEERQHMARQMHDDIAQTLGYLGLQVDSVMGSSSLAQNVGVQAELEGIRRAIEDAYERVRSSIMRLTEDVPGHFDLGTALPEIISEFEKQTGCRVESRVDEGQLLRLPPLVRLSSHLYHP